MCKDCGCGKDEQIQNESAPSPASNNVVTMSQIKGA
jgi:hypothetical protein